MIFWYSKLRDKSYVPELWGFAKTEFCLYQADHFFFSIVFTIKVGLHMKYDRIKKGILVPLVAIPTLLGASAVLAQDTVVDTSILDEAKAVAAEAIQAGAQAQQRIIELSDEADELVQEYSEQSKIVDGLEVYNAQYRRTIEEQERTIAQYDASIEQAAALQRQIPPLMNRMMQALEEFVAMDMPFLVDERNQRLQIIRDSFVNSNVNVAERFRLVLAAYQQEINYGRVLQHYTDILPINGVERDVDILRVGRIALLYQTSDQTSTGAWDKEAGQWVELDDQYRRPIADAIRIAQGLATAEILELPISAPE